MTGSRCGLRRIQESGFGIQGTPPSPAPSGCLPPNAGGGSDTEILLRNRAVSGPRPRPLSLARIERETLVRPIRHGARVVLPRDPEQGVLFD
jgi:hypothetical protein